MSQQKQDVGDNSTANLAGRDVHQNVYNSGLTPTQIIEIIDALNGMIDDKLASSEEQFIRRLEEFKDETVKAFFNPDKKSYINAFSDIDFKYSLRMAQTTFGRFGGDDLKNRLVELLLERSTKETNSRMAHVLNKAISNIGILPNQEIYYLVTIFIIGSIQVTGLRTDKLIENLRVWLGDFIDDFSIERNSAEYLTGEGFTYQKPVSSSFWDIFAHQFSGCFSLGFTESEYINSLSGYMPSETSHPPLVHVGYDSTSVKLIQFNVKNREELESYLPIDWPEEARLGTLALFDQKQLPLDAVKNQILTGFPALAKIESNWDSSRMNVTVLTPLGKAIAHSVLKGRKVFNAPIEMWVS